MYIYIYMRASEIQLDTKRERVKDKHERCTEKEEK